MNQPLFIHICTVVAPSTPNPAIPFAVLRNAHEGLRGGIAEMTELLGADDVSGFSSAWKDFQRVLAVHAQMEDEDIFALLDAVGGGVIGKEAIPEEHITDMQLQQALDAVLGSADAEAVKNAFNEWKAFFVGHLEHEERILPPLTGKVGSNGEERARAVYEKVVVPADRRNAEEFAFFIHWMVKQLSTRGSTANTAVVATRVFVHGLKAASDAEQWARWLPVIKASCTSTAVWEEMASVYQIETPAKQVPVSVPAVQATPVAAVAKPGLLWGS